MATAATASSMIMSSSRKDIEKPTNAARKIRQEQRWRCDVCQILSFKTLPEACAHEEICRRKKEEKEKMAQQQQNSRKQQQVAKPPKQQQLLVKKKKPNESSAKRDRTGADNNTEKHSTGIQNCNANSNNPQIDLSQDAGSDESVPEIDLSQDTTSSDSAEDVKQLEEPPVRRSARVKKPMLLDGCGLQKKKRSAPVVDLLMDDTNSADDDGNKQKRSKKKKTSNDEVKGKGSKKGSDLMPALFAMSEKERKAVLQEQAAAEFRAKRLLKEKEQREKLQRKRQQQEQVQHDHIDHKELQVVAKSNGRIDGESQVVLKTNKTTATAHFIKPVRRREGRFGSAIRFPVPSHIAPNDDSTSHSRQCHTEKEDEMKSIKISPEKSFNNTDQSEKDKMPGDEERNVVLLPAKNDPCAEDDGVLSSHPLQGLLASLLIPPTVPAISDCSVSQLWVEKYAITAQDIPVQVRAKQEEEHSDRENDGSDDEAEDVQDKQEVRDNSENAKAIDGDKGANRISCLSPQLIIAAKDMRLFVETWRGERQSANERAEERQRKLNKRRKLRKKNKCDKYDDEFYSDEEEDGRLANLCVVTGPVGCGKTNLVHAVAKSCRCRVLEINTSENRGSASLRKILTEATQSHSSIEMLRQNQKRTAKPSFFGLQDSDEENEDEGKKRASLTVVLIDEADLLFEDDGDNGFWSALKDLSRRAKCPIFLTANNSRAVTRYLEKHNTSCIEIDEPSPSECAVIMRQIIEAEGFKTRFMNEDGQYYDSTLEVIAELCNCDLRRICHELQLFARSILAPAPFLQGSGLVSVSESRAPENPLVEIKLTCVNPKGVRSEEYNLVTIKGTGFLRYASPGSNKSYEVNVLIGNHPSPHARIMNDSTILAVVPPFPPLPDVVIRRNHSYRDMHRRFYSAEYKSISVSSIQKFGAISTTESAIDFVELSSGKSMISLQSSCILTCHFSSVEGHDAQIDSGMVGDGDAVKEEEFEFGARSQAEKNSLPFRARELDAKQIDDSHAIKVLEKGLEKWGEDIPPVLKEPSSSYTSNDLDVLVRLSDQAACVSDAAFLKDYSMLGLHLSGASRGFGFEMTDAFPALTNENSETPSEERLFGAGWKDDCYFYGGADSFMTVPTAREKRLMRFCESRQRGQGFSAVAVDESRDEDEEDKEPRPSSDRNDEDCFLPQPMPAWLQWLSEFLCREDASLTTREYGEKISTHLLSKRKSKKMESFLRLANTHIFHCAEDLCCFFARGLPRVIDPLLHDEFADARLFLDYFPILRMMSVFEEESGKKSESSEAEQSIVSGRTTRRSLRHKLGRRKHYFVEKNFFDGNHAEAEETAKMVGFELANACLAVIESHLKKHEI